MIAFVTYRKEIKSIRNPNSPLITIPEGINGVFSLKKFKVFAKASNELKKSI
jgi:hypothetical protein